MTTQEQTLEAIGVTDRSTYADQLRALAKAVDDAHCDPGVLDILQRDAASKLREKFSYGEESLLVPDALERATRAERSKWIEEIAAKQDAAEAALPVLRARTEDRIARQRVLPGEAAAPAASRQERLLAQLVDMMGEREAEEWINRRNAADVFGRYVAASGGDDVAERAFVRVVERRHAARLLDFASAKDALAMAKQFTEAIEERQRARVRVDDAEALKALDVFEERLTRSRLTIERERAALRPTGDKVARAVGKLLAHGAKRGQS